MPSPRSAPARIRRCDRRARPGARAARRRIESRAGAAACLAAARPSGGAEPCFGADERRHDQGRDLRLHPHRLRSARPAELVVGAWRCWRLAAITAVLGVLYALMQHDLKRLLAYHTVENIGIIFIGLGLALAFRANGMELGGGAGAHRGAVPCLQSFAVQEPAVLRRRRRADRDRRARHGTSGRPHPSHADDGASPSSSAASRSRRCRRSTASSRNG